MKVSGRPVELRANGTRFRNSPGGALPPLHSGNVARARSARVNLSANSSAKTSPRGMF